MKRLKIILSLEGIAIVILLLLIVIVSIKSPNVTVSTKLREQEGNVHYYSMVLGDFLNLATIDEGSDDNNLLDNSKSRFFYALLILQNDQNTDDYLSYKVSKEVLSTTYLSIFGVNDNLDDLAEYDSINTCTEASSDFCWNTLGDRSEKYELLDGEIVDDTYTGDYLLYDADGNAIGNGNYSIDFSLSDGQLVISSASIRQ